MLTREYILSLPAGREMDALVAEKVMGFVISEETTDKQCYVEEEEEGYGIVHRYYPVSTNINNAWEVVEKLKNPECEVYWFFDHWESWFGKHGIAKADTAPLSICRAALLTTIQGEES